VAHKPPAADNRPRPAVHPDRRNLLRPQGQTHKRAVHPSVADRSTRRPLHPTTSRIVRYGPHDASARLPRPGDRDRHARQNCAPAGCLARSVHPAVHALALVRRVRDPDAASGRPACRRLSAAACSAPAPAPPAQRRLRWKPAKGRPESAWMCSCSHYLHCHAMNPKAKLDRRHPKLARPWASATLLPGFAPFVLLQISKIGEFQAGFPSAFISACCHAYRSPCRAKAPRKEEMS